MGAPAGLGGGKPNALTISLQPLSETETQKLIAALIDPTLLAVEAERELLVRAEGNPLYAQEYVRMLVERGADASALPESVQGIIAARLDALSAEEKSLLQDPAVIGRTAWLGALCALGERDRAAADELVFRLERKQLVRRARRSSVAGETELSFAHNLIEEVAYAQLTRPQRAERHERAAAWVEELTADREDRAQLVAYHLTTALELRDALAQDTEALRDRTLRTLVAASRQAARSDPAATIALAEQALELGPDQDVRAELLVRRAVAHVSATTATEALLVEARDAALAAGRGEDAVHAAFLLVEWAEGSAADGAVLDRLGSEAYELAAGLPPGPLTNLPAYVLAYRHVIRGRYAEALAFVDAEIARAREAGDDQAGALMLIWRGAARVGAGEPAGADDLREAYRILDHHAHPKAAVGTANLGEILLVLGRTEEARTSYAEGLAWARRTGHRRAERICLAWIADLACHAGEFERAAELLDTAARTRGEDEFSAAVLGLCRGRLALPMRPDETVTHTERVLAYAETTHNDEIRLHAHGPLARAHYVRGDGDSARAACDAFLARWHAVGGLYSAAVPLVEVGLVLAADGRHADLARALALLTTPTPWADATRSLANGSYDEAASILDGIPSIPLRDAARALADERRLAAGQRR